MVRSMEAVKRVKLPGVTWDPCGTGCHATECTQSSCPTRSASMLTVYRLPPASNRGLGAYLLQYTHTHWLQKQASITWGPHGHELGPSLSYRSRRLDLSVLHPAVPTSICLSPRGAKGGRGTVQHACLGRMACAAKAWDHPTHPPGENHKASYLKPTVRRPYALTSPHLAFSSPMHSPQRSNSSDQQQSDSRCRQQVRTSREK
jgi:hypothetical protein